MDVLPFLMDNICQPETIAKPPISPAVLQWVHWTSSSSTAVRCGSVDWAIWNCATNLLTCWIKAQSCPRIRSSCSKIEKKHGKTSWCSGQLVVNLDITPHFWIAFSWKVKPHKFLKPPCKMTVAGFHMYFPKCLIPATLRPEFGRWTTMNPHYWAHLIHIVSCKPHLFCELGDAWQK